MRLGGPTWHLRAARAHVLALMSPVIVSRTHACVSSPLHKRAECESWESTCLMLRNDCAGQEIQIQCIRSRDGFRVLTYRYPTPAPPEGRTTKQGRHHFPIITHGRPFLVILPVCPPSSTQLSVLPFSLYQAPPCSLQRLPVMSS